MNWTNISPETYPLEVILPACFLSIILPVYNEQSRLPNTLCNLFAYLEQQDYTYEVIVVENGSSDRTYQIACSLIERYPQLKVLHEDQKGKGLAVKRGMLAAQGDYRFMCDVDFSMPITELPKFFPPKLMNVDVAIASRELETSIRYNEPHYRHWIGRIFNLLIKLIALPGFYDTQCGFKCFRAEVAEDIFSYQTIAGWTFDVELLYIAKERGYRIVEIAIPWYFNAESKVRVVHDSARMALDLLTIRWNAYRNQYRSENEAFSRR